MKNQLKVFYRLFLLAGILLCLPVKASTIEKTINTTVGSTFTINPWGDAKSKFPNYVCVNTSYIVDDATAFTINEMSATKTRYPTYNNQYAEGYYKSYKVQALKTGTYIITGRGGCNKKSGTDLYTGPFTVVYHVIVKEKPIVTSISIPNSLNLTIGDSYTFSPVIIQDGASTILSWNSNNPNVVSISNNGTIKALSSGTSIISCTSSNGISAQCVVTVNAVLANSISLNYQELTLEEGMRETLIATILPDNTTNKDVSFRSSDSNIVLVGTNGTVVGLKQGWASVTATTTDGSNKSATCMIEVLPAVVKAETIKMNKNILSLSKGCSEQLNAIISPSNVTNKKVLWSTNNDCIAVDEIGNVTALQAGQATVTAKTSDGTNLSTYCDVTVNEMDISAFDNIIYFKHATGVAGKDVTLSLDMKNADDITAIQFDIVLPAGIAIRKKSDDSTYDIKLNETSCRTDTESHSINSALQENGLIRVLCYSVGLNVFAGNEGTILDIPIEISEDLAVGGYYILCKNIVLTNKEGGKYTIDNYSSLLNVVSANIGDTNADGVVDVTDIVTMANFILGNNTGTFIQESADLNTDGNIDVVDIVSLANKILGGSSHKNATTKNIKKKEMENNYGFEITPFTICAGQKSHVVTLNLYNPNTEITAFQLDLSLPDGLSVDLNRRGTAFNLSFNTESDRTDATYHTLSSAKQDNGDIRILCYSTSLDVFWGDEGALVNVPITAASEMQAGVYDFYIRNIVLTKPDETKIVPVDYHGSIVVGNGGVIKDIQLYGIYTEDALKEFSNAFVSNKTITSVNMQETSILTENPVEFMTGNPNFLLYVNEGQAFTNSRNIVVNNVCNNLELTDNMPFNAPIAFLAQNASYTRTVPNKGWYSLCLPFAPITITDIIFEKYVDINTNGNVITFENEITPQAYTPYIFFTEKNEVQLHATNVNVNTTPEIISENAFVGTLSGVDAPNIKNSYALFADGSGFGKAGETAYVKPFRAYLRAESSNASKIALVHDGVTAIDAVAGNGLRVSVNGSELVLSSEEGRRNVTIWSVDGRVAGSVELVPGRTASVRLQKGIYVVDKTKVIVR